jgi:hypothetical protein
MANLSRWLDISSSDELKSWCESIGWTVEGDAAVVPKNGDNDVKAGVVKENVELSREWLTSSRSGLGWHEGFLGRAGYESNRMDM